MVRVIRPTPDRLTIHEPSARLTAIAMAEGGVALKVTGDAAYLDRATAAILIAWLTEATA